MTTPEQSLTPALITVAGTVLVAWLAGAFSALGLVITKEQKVSEFRQAWIDSLRADMASFVARAYQILAYIRDHRNDFRALWTETRDDFIELNEASLRIKLRLNPDERGHQSVLGLVTQMENLLQNINDSEAPQKITAITKSLERDAPVLLKKEWKRVKDGETVYRIVKYLAIILFAAITVVIGLILRRVSHTL